MILTLINTTIGVILSISPVVCEDGDSGHDFLGDYNHGSVLNGGNSHDIVIGRDGHDILTSGTGIDAFVYNSVNDGHDKIADFQLGGDAIDLSSLLRYNPYNPNDNNINDFLTLIDDDNDSLINIDAEWRWQWHRCKYQATKG